MLCLSFSSGPNTVPLETRVYLTTEPEDRLLKEVLFTICDVRAALISHTYCVVHLGSSQTSTSSCWYSFFDIYAYHWHVVIFDIIAF